VAALRTQLQPILQGPPQPSLDRPIHSGQFWHLSPAPHQHPARTIYEILQDTGPPGSPPLTPMAPNESTLPSQPSTRRYILRDPTGNPLCQLSLPDHQLLRHPARHHMEKATMPAHHPHGLIWTSHTPYILCHMHGPSPDTGKPSEIKLRLD
jgi:hypothetical protein